MSKIADDARDPRPLILFAIPALDGGGPDRVMFELITGLARERFRVALAVQQRGGRYFERLPADVAVHLVEGGRYPVRAFARLVDAVRPDLVFTTLRMNLTAQIATYLQRHRPPLISRQANAIAADFQQLKKKSLIKHRIAEQIVRRALNRADALVAQSRDMAAEIAPTLRRGQRLVTIGNPVDLNETRALAMKQGEGAVVQLPGSPALIAVGRLMAQKGFDLLIAALPAILTRYPDAALTILGEGEDRAALMRQAEALGIADRVRMPGQSDRVLAMVARADLFVSSSRYEGFSNAVLEAIALGTPVAATACPGATCEMIEDGQSGTLARAITPEAIADAVLRALEGDGSAYAAAARAHAAATFSREAIKGAYAELFSETIAAAQPR